MNTSHAPQPQPSVSQQAMAAEKIPNYLIWAILCTLCCCLPGGIVSIVYSTKVDSLVGAGDIEGARDASNKAKLWAMISGGVGLVVNGLLMAFMLFGIMAGAANA